MQIAFVADGAVLPRRSGASDLPMVAAETPVVPFTSPPSLTAEFTLPNRGVVRGMGVPKGVTIIVGGGFHGKSTLLQAVEVRTYPRGS
jgi:predicted ABC-class ATPase